MGGSASLLRVDSSEFSHAEEDLFPLREGGVEVGGGGGGEDSATRKRPYKSTRLFQAAPEGEVTASELSDYAFLEHNQHPMDISTRELLDTALNGFFFLQNDNQNSGSGAPNHKTEMLIRAMRREEISEGHTLIVEGEPGSKLYVVQSGELQVSINGDLIRTMGRGAMLGELALLYDSPRSATVKAKSSCIVWSLARELFKKILAMSSDASSVQRSRWLIASPELAVLSAINLSRLVGALKTIYYEPGDVIYREMGITNTIILLEKGYATVQCSMDVSQDVDPLEVDKMFTIIRPSSKKKSVASMNQHELKQFITNFDDTYTGPRDEEEEIDADNPALREAELTSNGGGEGAQAAVPMYYACDVYEGCILGLGALRGRAGMSDSWRWVTNEEMVRKGLIKEGSLSEGAETPFTVVANSKLTVQTFTVDVFENLFGPISTALQPSAPNLSKNQYAANNEMIFDTSKFKILAVLGAGSFGTVTLAQYMDFTGFEPPRYALKSLNKVAVLETGQLRHVIDERKLLSTMDSRFVLKLFGVYQTPHQLVMVTEPVECGDLWSVVYETPPFAEKGGIPPDLAKFYMANLVFALTHIHERGIVFRDLKPENVMLDRNGYLRVIDFGFAKRVPFTRMDPDGTMRVYAKTFTLCGTPEYLSPELIFNLGHDQSSDLWALGVMCYEMIMGKTPFAPRRPENITELFTNIAMVKKNGLLLSPRIDEKAGGSSDARDLITRLLKPESSERIGMQEGSTSVIALHAYFKDIDTPTIFAGTYVPSYIPRPVVLRDLASDLQPVKSYNGDQSLFADF